MHAFRVGAPLNQPDTAMKKGLFILLVSFLALPALAQHRLGWYVGPGAGVTQFNGDVGVLSGFEAGVIINRRVSVGIESWRLLNGVEADRPDNAGNHDAEFFFSGISTRYTVPFGARLNVEPRLLVGGGEAHWRTGFWDGMVGDWHRDAAHTTSLVLVPGANLDYALAPWLRATVGANYRLVTAGKSHVVGQRDMGGFAGSFSLRFGRF